MCKSQANNYADNGVYGLSMPSQLGFPAVVRGGWRACGRAFPLRVYAKGRLFGQAFWETELTDLVFRASPQASFRRMVLDRDKERKFTEQPAQGTKASRTRKRR
jgi:hypothetical protein